MHNSILWFPQRRQDIRLSYVIDIIVIPLVDIIIYFDNMRNSSTGEKKILKMYVVLTNTHYGYTIYL